MLYASGLFAICEHVAAPVEPELIPVPKVPKPVQRPAEINIIPLSTFSVSDLVRRRQL